MTQSEFASYVGLAPATLSSIFNGRTRPTLNVVEVLKKKGTNTTEGKEKVALTDNDFNIFESIIIILVFLN